MKTVRKYLSAAFVFLPIVFSFSCSDDVENYPVEPNIKSAKVAFGDSGEPSDYDTLSVTISFTDGDGDLGLDYPSDTLSPYHPLWVFLKTTGEAVPSDDLFTGKVAIEELIRLSDRQTPPYDTLPDRSEGCYDLSYRVRGLYNDPPYSRPNENHYNILIDFLFEDPNGNFVEFDFYKEYCTTFNGIFSGRSGQDGPFLLKMDGKNKGQLTYRMISLGFVPLFGDKKMKLRLYIKDRALHNSNAIETAPFFLTDI